MFFVYHGYVSPDHYDSSEGPTYKMESFKSEAEVLAFKKEFDELITSDCDHFILIVFSGKELELVPVKTVTEWSLR